MGRKALTILLLFSLCSEFFSFATDDGGPNPVYKRGSTALELALPPSPEAASRVKYADVPFSHSMGLAEYEVAGAAGYTFGFSSTILLKGADWNSRGYFSTKRDYNGYTNQPDSKDDQKSISLGAKYAKTHSLRRKRHSR